MGHYYDELGVPKHFIEMTTKEGTRPTTIKDAKKLNLNPGATTILSLLSKENLRNWQFEQLIKTVLTNFPKEPVTEENFKKISKELIYKSQNLTKQASDRGQQLHDLLSQYFRNPEILSLFSTEEQEYISPIIEQVHKLGVTDDWKSEETFGNSRLGYGGTVDLYSPKLHIIIDFKSKFTDNESKFEPYLDHLLQLSSYRNGLAMYSARCVNIYFSSTTPNKVKVHEWKLEELAKGTKMFKLLVEYWRLLHDIEAR